MGDNETYHSNEDMKNFVDQEFMREIEQEVTSTCDQGKVLVRGSGDSQVHYEGALITDFCQPSSPGTEDLDGKLVEAGWRKFWSDSKNHFYFFNKLTNESLWELPGSNVPFDVPRSLTNTLSLSHMSADLNNALTKTNDDHCPTERNNLKRRSTDDSVGGIDRKHTKPEAYWNLTINADVVIMEGSPCNLPPPIPEVEKYRANLTNQLRQNYHDLCRACEGVDAPNESFNRWILERKVCDKGNDPMLPTRCDSQVSPSMYREIMHDLPIRLSRIKYISDARKQLFCYAEAARKMIERRSATPESRKLIKWHTEETFSWLRKEQNALLEDYLDRLSYLRRNCGPHLAEMAKDSVETICCKMYNLAQDCAKKIHDKNLAVLGANNIEIPEKPEPSKRLIQASPCKMMTSSPPVPVIQVISDKMHVCITYQNEAIRIKHQFMKKLEALYRFSCHDDPSLSHFPSRLWCLLRRYQTMFGPNQYEGIVLQGALPVPVFESLNKTFGVTMECFASPLNCYFRNYCSAFTDTDSYFGSSGPILRFFPVSGSFEANAPFEEELMEAMVDHFERLLGQTNKPLSFIVFVPEWRDPTPVATLRMETSQFKRKQVLIPAFEHEYRSGLQHIAPDKEVYHKSVHGTLLFFLQNKKGYEKWGPTPERLLDLLDAFRPSLRSAKLSSSIV